MPDRLPARVGFHGHLEVAVRVGGVGAVQILVPVRNRIDVVVAVDGQDRRRAGVVLFPPIGHEVLVDVRGGLAGEWAHVIGDGRVDAQFGVVDRAAFPGDDIAGSNEGDAGGAGAVGCIDGGQEARKTHRHLAEARVGDAVGFLVGVDGVVVEFLAAVGVAGVAVAFVNDAVVVRAVGGDGGAAGGIGRVLELWPQADPCYGDSFPTGLVGFARSGDRSPCCQPRAPSHDYFPSEKTGAGNRRIYSGALLETKWLEFPTHELSSCPQG